MNCEYVVIESCILLLDTEVVEYSCTGVLSILKTIYIYIYYLVVGASQLIGKGVVINLAYHSVRCTVLLEYYIVLYSLEVLPGVLQYTPEYFTTVPGMYRTTKYTMCTVVLEYSTVKPTIVLTYSTVQQTHRST